MSALGAGFLLRGRRVRACVALGLMLIVAANALATEQPAVLVNTFNNGAVRNRPPNAMQFTLKAPRFITKITTYHWNGGRGAPCGEISLRDGGNRKLGPWPAQGSGGQGGVSDAFWTCEPRVMLQPGIYTLVDGDPATWSWNPESDGMGFARVEGTTGEPATDREGRAALRNMVVLGEASRVRNIAAFNLEDAISSCPVGHSLDFLRDSPVGRDVPEAWACFFAGSFVLMGHAAAPKPVMAYYNPWLDAALITQWEWQGGHPFMQRAVLWVASEFPEADGGAKSSYARWLVDSESTPIPEALRSRYQKFVAAFDAAYPVSPDGGASLLLAPNQEQVVEWVGRQAVDVLATLLRVQRRGHPAYSDDLHRFRQALQNGDRAALAAMLPEEGGAGADTLLKLPAGLRARLVPTYAIAREGGPVIAFLGITDMPRFYVLTAFAAKPGDRMTKALVCDLGKEATR
ncbi:MAG: hypothetical protein K1X53_15170 [Candidatus Sumerlaeaceae bacterium]|nr:hypothetical protein [Candidatus Sumerlaeaceae bacterium]